MFNFFRKKSKIPKVVDKVWMSENERKAGFITDLKRAVSENKMVLILYFFKDTKKEIEQLLNENDIRFQKAALGNFSSNVILIPTYEIGNDLGVTNAVEEHLSHHTSTLFFVEHYPVYSKENEVLERLGELSTHDLKTSFYVSMTDPILKIFGSERMVEMMKKMQMKEGECIEHAMISKAINRAQQKLERSIEFESQSDSQEEWFRRNTSSFEA